MGRPLKQLIAEALELSAAERARLAERLILSLDDDAEDGTPNCECTPEDEIRRRLDEVDAGTAELIPAEHVFAELRLRRAVLDDEGNAGEPWENVLDEIELRDE